MPSLKKGTHCGLQPSMHHYLMCGSLDRANLEPVRLWGWPDTLIAIAKPKLLKALWDEHAEALIAEATAAGFRPVAEEWFRSPAHWVAHDDVPTDRNPAREAWSRKFCDEHEY